MWRACSNALATRDNLFRRKCSVSPTCQICHTNAESVEHLLFECPWTRPIWFGSSLNLRFETSPNTITDCIATLLDAQPSAEQRQHFLLSLSCIAWFIWRSRNNYVFEDTALCPVTVLSRSLLLETDLVSIFSDSWPQRNSSSVAPQSSSPRWIPPPDSKVKLNCDASFVPHKAGYGIVIRNSQGSLISCFGKPCLASSPLHAELLAIHAACSEAIQRGWNSAIIESDSQVAIYLVSSKTLPPWNVATLVDDIRLWASSLNLSFSWVSRDVNRAAHWVAHSSVIFDTTILWIDNVPAELTSILRSDYY